MLRVECATRLAQLHVELVGGYVAQTDVLAERRIETGTAVHNPMVVDQHPVARHHANFYDECRVDNSTVVFAHRVIERVHDLGVDIERRQCSAEVADALWSTELVERD
jgi:hypothetical protein